MIDELGVGIVYVPGIEEFIEKESDLLDIIELEPQTLWLRPSGDNPPPAYDDFLAWLRSRPQAKIVHGVGTPVGGCRAPSSAESKALAIAVNRLDASSASVHPAFHPVLRG